MKPITGLGIAAVGIGIDQYAEWSSYKSAVGVENTSARGFRIWKDQSKAVARRQPRVNSILALVTGIASILFAYLYLVNLDGVLALATVFAFVAFCVFKHRPRTLKWRREQAAVNNWHRAGCPQGQAPNVVRSF